MWAGAKDDENEGRKAQVLHCFESALMFLLTYA